MKQVIHIAHLIRPLNLLIIILAMYLMRLMLVEPLLIMSRQAPSILPFNFFLLVLSTILIAAGGYIINDIEDVAIDEHNNRKNAITLQLISRDAAYILYLALSFCGICIGFYLTFIAGIHYIAFINLIAAGLLYFYSTIYKRQFLIGNIIVSILTSLCFAIVYLSEPYAPKIDALKTLCSGYIFFSFLLNMAREIIKDMEDIPGDAAAGCKTMPIVAGIITSKFIAGFFILILFLLLVAIQIKSRQWEALIPFSYVALFIEIPLILLIVTLVIAHSTADFKRSSTLAKFIMITGILSIPVFFYSF